VIEAIAEACGPTAIICAVLGSFAFLLDKPMTGVGFYIFAGALIVVWLICFGILRWRGDW